MKTNIRVRKTAGDTWFCLKDVLKQLPDNRRLRHEIQSIREAFQGNSAYAEIDLGCAHSESTAVYKVTTFKIPNVLRVLYPNTFINEKLFCWVLNRSSAPLDRKVELVASLGLSAYSLTAKTTPFCDITLKLISITFGDLPSYRNYFVPPYFVDLYFPTIKLVVDCDEKKPVFCDREPFITEALGCRFIHYSTPFQAVEAIQDHIDKYHE